MKLHPFISFLTALIITAIIVGAGYGVLLILTFNLAGGETLANDENKIIGGLFFSIIPLMAAIVSANHYIKRKKKITAYGIVAVPIIVVLGLLFSLVKPNIFPTKFDEATWKHSNPKPDDMAKSLVRQKTLIGLTKAQVTEMLGEGGKERGQAASNTSPVLYSVKNEWTLYVYFENDKVVKTELRLPGLSV